MVDGALDGAVNMQRDETLLQQSVEEHAKSFVRIYRWAVPTVSLGYFQKPDAEVDSRLKDCPRVRRVTGGGAILHDDELTYSCVLPPGHPLKSAPVELYSVVHSALIALLGDCGVSCSMRMNMAASGSAQATTAEPFLCFLRADPRDVVLHGQKIIGSAQRRRKGSILQHGSILLRASTLTPEIPGIVDLVPDFDQEQFSEKLPAVVAGAVSGNIELVTMTEADFPAP